MRRPPTLDELMEQVLDVYFTHGADYGRLVISEPGAEAWQQIRKTGGAQLSAAEYAGLKETVDAAIKRAGLWAQASRLSEHDAAVLMANEDAAFEFGLELGRRLGKLDSFLSSARDGLRK